MVMLPLHNGDVTFKILTTFSDLKTRIFVSQTNQSFRLFTGQILNV